jgi:hypothetical protein
MKNGLPLQSFCTQETAADFFLQIFAQALLAAVQPASANHEKGKRIYRESLTLERFK